jgi:hypothetical protein
VFALYVLDHDERPLWSGSGRAYNCVRHFFDERALLLGRATFVRLDRHKRHPYPSSCVLVLSRYRHLVSNDIWEHAKPPINRGVGVFAHESVIHHIPTFKNLAVNLSLSVVTHGAPGPGKHCLNEEEILHLLGLEDTALRIDKRDALALENESRL